MKRVALIEPLGDPGIGTYAHELAEALSARGLQVDLYTNGRAWTLHRLSRGYRIVPVLGSSLIRQRAQLDSASRARASLPQAAVPDRRARILRDSYLSIELAAWLRLRRYDLVWTQWPTMGHARPTFWSAARALGLRVVHTVHNVLPHERHRGDTCAYGHVYRRSRLILAHSHAAAAELARRFPESAGKVIVSRHGLYTAYPREPAARARVRTELGIADDAQVVLCFGGIRPYKNTEAVVRAVAAQSPDRRLALIVAGRETPDHVADPLAGTRRLVEQLGLGPQTRLLTGPFGFRETSALFEAADVVPLPYLESSGSGVLLLAMSFGKLVVASRAGGMDEYLNAYPAHVLLDDASERAVADGLARALARVAMSVPALAGRPPDLEWPHIVDQVLPQLL